jgi:hypothetical protein
MLIKRKRGWELGENQATPEGCYLKRRELVRAMGLGAAAAALPSMAWAEPRIRRPPSTRPSATTNTACRRP